MNPLAVALTVCLPLAACAATSNPAPPERGAVLASPTAKAATDPPSAERPAAAPAEPQPAPGPLQEPAGSATPAETHAQGPPVLPIGRIGEESLDVRAFLERLWMRDAQSARDVLDYLVWSRISLFEAERLGVRLDPAQVEAMLERAYTALREKLELSGSKQTLEEHIQRVMEMDEQSYDRKLRADAILQLLTERCVRAWYLGNPRVRIVLTELPDETTLAAAQAALGAGQPFADVARAFGVDESAPQGGAQMTLVRSESSALSRLAFGTPVGEVGGPLEQQGRFLLVFTEQRFEGHEGDWREVGATVEQSLQETPIDADKLEYVQWRSAMMRRYPIDLQPFRALVTATTP